MGKIKNHYHNEIEAKEILSELNGVFLGSLDPHEIEAFEYLESIGKASLKYEGAAGLLGLGKIVLYPALYGQKGEREYERS